MSDAGDLAEVIAKKLGAPAGTIPKLLLADDDWSFVIKVHAFLEASLRQFISARLGAATLDETVGHLNIRGATGKLAFAKALGAPKQLEQVANALSSLRNQVTHDVSQINFTFKAWVEETRALNMLHGKASALIFPFPLTAKINDQTLLDHLEGPHAKSVVILSILFWCELLQDGAQSRAAIPDVNAMTDEDFAAFSRKHLAGY